jgi:hypothetical protein
MKKIFLCLIPLVMGALVASCGENNGDDSEESGSSASHPWLGIGALDFQIVE